MKRDTSNQQTIIQTKARGMQPKNALGNTICLHQQQQQWHRNKKRSQLFNSKYVKRCYINCTFAYYSQDTRNIALIFFFFCWIAFSQRGFSFSFYPLSLGWFVENEKKNEMYEEKITGKKKTCQQNCDKR